MTNLPRKQPIVQLQSFTEDILDKEKGIMYSTNFSTFRTKVVVTGQQESL